MFSRLFLAKAQSSARTHYIMVMMNCVATMNELRVFRRSIIICVAALFYFYRFMTDKDRTALFIGNRDCYQVKEADIKQAIITAIENGIEIFLNGGQGYFDRTCAAIIYRLKKSYPHIKSMLVIPYRDFKVFNDSLFDEIIYPFEAHIASYYTYKGGIPKRNRWLVDHSSIAICYVYRASGAEQRLNMQKEKA